MIIRPGLGVPRQASSGRNGRQVEASVEVPDSSKKQVKEQWRSKLQLAYGKPQDLSHQGTLLEGSKLSTRAFNTLTTEGLLTAKDILEAIQENDGLLPPGTVKNSSDTGREIIHYALAENAKQKGETSITEFGLETKYFNVLLRIGLFTVEDVLQAIRGNSGVLPNNIAEHSGNIGHKIIDFALNLNAKKKRETSITDTELGLGRRHINALLKEDWLTAEDVLKALSAGKTIIWGEQKTLTQKARDQKATEIAVLKFWAKQTSEESILSLRRLKKEDIQYLLEQKLYTVQSVEEVIKLNNGNVPISNKYPGLNYERIISIVKAWRE